MMARLTTIKTLVGFDFAFPPSLDEAAVVSFRKHTLLLLDDCLYTLQPTIPHLTRSFAPVCSAVAFRSCRRVTGRASRSARPIRSAISTSTLPRCRPPRASPLLPWHDFDPPYVLICLPREADPELKTSAERTRGWPDHTRSRIASCATEIFFEGRHPGPRPIPR